MLKYYVSHESQQMGPYTVDEIVHFVKLGTLSPLDYIYDEEKSDWLLFMEHGTLAEKVKALKPKAPPRDEVQNIEAKIVKPAYKNKKEISDNVSTQEWFVLKGENKFGPFSFNDVVKMLQQGAVFEFDFVWHEGLSGWERIAETAVFKSDNLKALLSSQQNGVNEVFFRRRYKRVNYGGTVLVHDHKKVWKGKSVEISEGGAGVIMDNSLVLPGQELFLHFKPGDGAPPFNAVCEVVSKQYVNEVANANAPIRYGLKFKNISSDVQKHLKEYTKKAA